MKQISRIFVSEAQSAKISPHNISHSTLKSQDKPSKPLCMIKEISHDLRIPEVKSVSTMASLQCYFSSDQSKSPLRAPHTRSSVTRLPPKLASSDKIPKMYRVKSSKISNSRKLTDSFQSTLNEYFVGVSLPRPRQSCEYYKTCNLEFTLQGSKNSVNCLEISADRVCTGDYSGGLRSYSLPTECLTPYTSSSYLKGTALTSHKLFGSHRRPVTAICTISGNVVSASQEGVLKVWDASLALRKSLRSPAGVKSMLALPSGKLVTGGSALCFWDLEKFSRFRDEIVTKPCNSMCVHSDFTFISGNEDCSVKLWDTRTPRSISSFEGHSGGVTGVALTSAQNIVSCSDDCTLREWDIRKADSVRVRKGKDGLRGITVKEQLIITGGRGIRVWGSEVLDEIYWHTGGVKEVRYCCGSGMLFAAGFDGVVSAWSFFNSRVM